MAKYYREDEEYILNKEGLVENIITHRREQEVLVKVQRMHFKKGEFYLVNFDFDRLILEKGYSNLTMRVLTVLKLRMEYKNRIETFRQREIAEILKTDRANISRCLKTLVEDKIIYKRNNNYYFSGKYIMSGGQVAKREPNKEHEN